MTVGHPEQPAGAQVTRRVVLVDDHRMFAEALALTLSHQPDLRVVDRCAAGEPELVTRVAAARPDVVVIDVEPLGRDAAGPVAALLAIRPGARIVVLTGSRDRAQMVDAVRAGALGWLDKGCTAADLLAAIRGVCVGEARLSPGDTAVVLGALRAELDPAARRDDPLAALSRQERRVLAGLVDGSGGPEIATALGVSPGTVRTHMNNVFGKLGVHSRLEAVRAARAAGLRPRAPVDRYPSERS